MPRMDGPRATKAIRELGFVGLILGVTGNVLQEDVETFKQHGANDVFFKPLELKKFDDMLAALRKKKEEELQSSLTHA